LRIFGKKRGERRTGSKLLGSVGEALFFSVLFLLGLISLVVLVASVQMRTWPASEYFPETYFRQTTCEVIQTRLGEQLHLNKPSTYRPEILIQYSVDGEVYRRWAYDSVEAYSPDREAEEEILAQYTDGQSCPCWYNPADPGQAIVKRGSTWGFWLTVLVLASFILIGAGGAVYTVVYAGTSAERRAALAKRASHIELIGEALPSVKDYPQVPGDANYTDSPGITLAYRLPMASSPGWSLLAATVFCVVWNLLATVFMIAAINKHVSGHPDWLLTIVTIPSVGIGLWSVYFASRRLLMATGVGPTNVEISDHPLRPGRSYDIFLAQLGHLSIRSLAAQLVCEEEATFRQGTNVRTEKCCVYWEEIFRRENVEIEPGTPFEHQDRFTVPVECMHSFKSENNAVAWSLVVEGDTVGWSTFRRKFPVVVYPAANGSGAR
jgi:hypothetical protein